MARKKKPDGIGIIFSLLQLAFSLVFALLKLATSLLLIPFKIAAASRSKKKTSRRAGATEQKPQGQKMLEANLQVLEKRWKRVEATNAHTSYPYDRPLTDNQKARLLSRGIIVSDKKLSSLTVGQASDINSLFYPVDDDDAEVLKFFKVPTTGLNQLSGVEKVHTLLENPANADKWAKRPPTPMQKEFYRFTSTKQPKGLNAIEMEENIQSILETLEEHLHDEWEEFASVYQEITSREYRNDNDVGKASLKQFRDAYASLKAEGKAFTDDLTVDDIVERIEEQCPGFQRY